MHFCVACGGQRQEPRVHIAKSWEPTAERAKSLEVQPPMPAGKVGLAKLAGGSASSKWFALICKWLLPLPIPIPIPIPPLDAALTSAAAHKINLLQCNKLQHSLIF